MGMLMQIASSFWHF